MFSNCNLFFSDFVATLSEDCTDVENSWKEDCGTNSNDADACKENGCCFNNYVPEGVPHCYKPCKFERTNERANA